jgi:ABC-type iron transport system FetAB ATPase subunit
VRAQGLEQPLVLVGPPGTGKSHLSIALGVEAIKAGRSVYFEGDAGGVVDADITNSQPMPRSWPWPAIAGDAVAGAIELISFSASSNRGRDASFDFITEFGFVQRTLQSEIELALTFASSGPESKRDTASRRQIR